MIEFLLLVLVMGVLAAVCGGLLVWGILRVFHVERKDDDDDMPDGKDRAE